MYSTKKTVQLILFLETSIGREERLKYVYNNNIPRSMGVDRQYSVEIKQKVVQCHRKSFPILYNSIR